jgi:hypothetical protein
VVEARAVVLERDHRRQLDHRGGREVLAQRREEGVRDDDRRPRHGRRVVEDGLLERREEGALAVRGERLQLVVGQARGPRLGRAQVDAERAAR